VLDVRGHEYDVARADVVPVITDQDASLPLDHEVLVLKGMCMVWGVTVRFYLNQTQSVVGRAVVFLINNPANGHARRLVAKNLRRYLGVMDDFASWFGHAGVSLYHLLWCTLESSSQLAPTILAWIMISEPGHLSKLPRAPQDLRYEVISPTDWSCNSECLFY